MNIEELDLSLRAYNRLKRHGYNTVSDIEKLSYEDLMGIEHMGKLCTEEILRKLTTL